MLITLYCNPFFAPCKEKIYEIHGFFQSIFERKPKKAEDTVDVDVAQAENGVVENNQAEVAGNVQVAQGETEDGTYNEPMDMVAYGEEVDAKPSLWDRIKNMK